VSAAVMAVLWVRARRQRRSACKKDAATCGAISMWMISYFIQKEANASLSQIAQKTT